MNSTDEELLVSAKQLSEDAKFQVNDVKAAIAAVNFILATSSTAIQFFNILFFKQIENQVQYMNARNTKVYNCPKCDLAKNFRI